MFKTIIKWLLTNHPEQEIRLSVKLMKHAERNGSRGLRRFFQRRIYYKHHCDISAHAQIDESVIFHHPLAIVIGEKAILGKNVEVYQCVTIGNANDKMPTIGDGTIIFAGAKLVGGIKVGSNCKIGANSVVTKDVPDNCTVVGVNRVIPHTD